MNPAEVMKAAMQESLAANAPAVIERECDCCKGTGKVRMSSITSGDSTWRMEAEFILMDRVPMGLRDPIIRDVIFPVMRANRILHDGDLGDKRFDKARNAASFCEQKDWREAMEEYITAVEGQTHGEES